MKALLLITGGLIGLVVGLHYVVAQIDASVVDVMPNYGDSTLELAPVSVQHFTDLTEQNDLQPALGYNFIQ